MDHGLLFKGPMARALLEGRKTQTRRVVTWHNSSLDGRRVGHRGARRELWDSLDWSRAKARAGSFVVPSLLEPGDETWRRVHPIYRPGDLIWVKETWGLLWPDGCEDGLIYDDEHPDGRPITADECDVVYRADTDDEYPGGWDPEDARGNPEAPKWQSAMLMPRRRCRLTMRVTQARAQRLQQISEADAAAEGIKPFKHGRGFIDPTRPEVLCHLGHTMPTARAAFQKLWDHINAPRGLGWAANPPVWALSFEPVKENPNA
jgi:hypothetical protein